MGSELQTLSKPQVSRRCPRRARRASPLSGWRLGPFSKGVLSSRHSRQSGFEQATRSKTGEGVYWRNETVGGMGKGRLERRSRRIRDGVTGHQCERPAVAPGGPASAGGRGAAALWLQPCAWPRVAEAAAAEKASRTPPAHPPVTASDRHHPQGIMCCSALFSQILCKFGFIASTHNHRGKGACGK